jgi:hypothetical protein
VVARHHEPGLRQRVVDVFALAIDRWIDFVRDAVVALAALEADIVRGGFWYSRVMIGSRIAGIRRVFASIEGPECQTAWISSGRRWA